MEHPRKLEAWHPKAWTSQLSQFLNSIKGRQGDDCIKRTPTRRYNGGGGILVPIHQKSLKTAFALGGTRALVWEWPPEGLEYIGRKCYNSSANGPMKSDLNSDFLTLATRCASVPEALLFSSEVMRGGIETWLPI